MAVNLVKSGISVAVGVGDVVVEDNDRRERRVESFRTASDLGRLAAAAGGYAIQAFFPRYQDIGEALALSATPLLVKSLARAMDIPKVSAAERAASFSATMRPSGRVALKNEYLDTVRTI